MHKRAVPGGAVDITDEVMAKIDGTIEKRHPAPASSAVQVRSIMKKQQVKSLP